MTSEEVLKIWAPSSSPWGRWTKAVLFSFMDSPIPQHPQAPITSWPVPFLNDEAFVLNLPGAEGVRLGLALAAVGYRPIPLYNACPHPIGISGSEKKDFNGSTVPVVDVIPTMRALENGADVLRNIALPASAPPAFLLDSDRHNAAVSPDVGWFDNRSIVRTSDLPSADFLRARGIERLVLVQSSERLQTDLKEMLLSWQDAGISLLIQSPSEPWHPSILKVQRPSFLMSLWNRTLLRLRYQPNSSGAFGRIVHGAASS
jgi:hypothetical protein